MSEANDRQGNFVPKSATVVITTRNRKSELRVAIKSAIAQTGDVEVLVIDDGSDDGTSEMVVAEFDSVRLHRNEQSVGLIVARNLGAQLATGDVIFSIDDDAEFTSPSTVMETLALFTNKRIAAIAIPYIDVRKSDVVRQMAPDVGQIWITDRFIGTAHAIRRGVFLTLNGYREALFHQGEERDFCQRALDAGYFVRLGQGVPIHHYESPRRDTTRMDIYGRRNDILFLMWNAPLLSLIWQLPATILNGLLFGIRVRRPGRMLRGIMTGVFDSWRYRKDRKPVSRTSFHLFRILQKRGPLEYGLIEALLDG